MAQSHCLKEGGLMKKKTLWIVLVLLLPLFPGFTAKAQAVSLWERMCEACHDGSTVLNGKVVPDKDEIRKKFSSLDALVDAVACKAPPCMNILKHDEKLVRKVGKEIGIGETKK